MKTEFKEYILLLQQAAGGIKNKTVLDIGTMTGKLPEQFAAEGAIVTAIDVAPLAVAPQSYEFINIPFEYFNVPPQTVRHFDIAIAHNVMPFLADKEYSMKKLLAIADMQLFNVWGHSHAWAKRRHVYTPEEIIVLKELISQTHEIITCKEAEFETPTFSDPDSLTHWHEYNFLIKRI